MNKRKSIILLRPWSAGNAFAIKVLYDLWKSERKLVKNIYTECL